MAFGVLEKEIVNAADSSVIDISLINDLFKRGADPNAIEKEPYPISDIDGEPCYSTLFGEALFNYENTSNIKEFLECFIQNGLDVHKYGSSIIAILHFHFEDNDIYEITKLILSSSSKKMSLKVGYDRLATEASYYLCCPPLENPEEDDYNSNYLYGVCEILDAYKEDKAYEEIYCSDRVIGQIFKSLTIKGDYKVLNNKEARVKYEKGKICLDAILEFEYDKLVVEDTWINYVNNARQPLEENKFTQYVNQYLQGETLIGINYHHYSTEISRTCHSQGTTIDLEFTNNKLISFQEDDNNYESIHVK